MHGLAGRGHAVASAARGIRQMDTLRKVLDYEMRIAEWIGLAVLLGIPYLGVGLLWALTHDEPFISAVLTWPLLLLYAFCGI
jgi:hypothetical protein